MTDSGGVSAVWQWEVPVMDGLYGPATRAEGPEGGKHCLLLVPEDGGKERALDPLKMLGGGLGLSA